MIDLLELINIEKMRGYSDVHASAKICQDLILKTIADGTMCRNVTIKGGVVMRSKTNDIRRATEDIDVDFIRYSLSDSAIDSFVDNLNSINEICFARIGKVEELRQQDYRGKRLYVQITDKKGHQVTSKIDFGVHKNFDIKQETYCFDISFSREGASLLINTNEQIFTEKLCSLLKFGPASTRYKDIFDMYYLIKHINRDELQLCLDTYIYQNREMRENNSEDIIERMEMTFDDKMYLRRIQSSDKNWIEGNITDIFNELLAFL